MKNCKQKFPNWKVSEESRKPYDRSTVTLFICMTLCIDACLFHNNPHFACVALLFVWSRWSCFCFVQVFLLVCLFIVFPTYHVERTSERECCFCWRNFPKGKHFMMFGRWRCSFHFTRVRLMRRPFVTSFRRLVLSSNVK